MVGSAVLGEDRVRVGGAGPEVVVRPFPGAVATERAEKPRFPGGLAAIDLT